MYTARFTIAEKIQESATSTKRHANHILEIRRRNFLYQGNTSSYNFPVATNVITQTGVVLINTSKKLKKTVEVFLRKSCNMCCKWLLSRSWTIYIYRKNVLTLLEATLKNKSETFVNSSYCWVDQRYKKRINRICTQFVLLVCTVLYIVAKIIFVQHKLFKVNYLMTYDVCIWHNLLMV